MPTVYIAMGSNVEPESNLTKAARQLAQEFPDVRFSSWYRNAAVGFAGQDFINGVAAFTTPLALAALIERLHAIEMLCDRPRDAPRWAPRTMDLDILLYGDTRCDQPGLKLPRPDLLKRAYMLGPLAELAPRLVHPQTGLTIGEHWRRFDRAAHRMAKVDLFASARPS